MGPFVMQPHPETGTPIGAMALLDAAARLIGHEWQLAKAEVSRNVGRASVGAGLLAGAFFIGTIAVGVLAGAGVAALAAAGLELWLAALIVGGGLALIAGIMAAIGLRKLSARQLIPARTLSNIQRDMDMLKEAANG
jgi:hypothetical protein